MLKATSATRNLEFSALRLFLCNSANFSAFPARGTAPKRALKSSAPSRFGARGCLGERQGRQEVFQKNAHVLRRPQAVHGVLRKVMGGDSFPLQNELVIDWGDEELARGREAFDNHPLGGCDEIPGPAKVIQARRRLLRN